MLFKCYFLSCVCYKKQQSLSDAEVREDVAEDFVGGNLAQYLAEVGEGEAEVLADEVAGEVGFGGGDGSQEGFAG